MGFKGVLSPNLAYFMYYLKISTLKNKVCILKQIGQET